MDIQKKKGEKIKKNNRIYSDKLRVSKRKSKKEKTTFGRYVNYLIVLTFRYTGRGQKVSFLSLALRR